MRAVSKTATLADGTARSKRLLANCATRARRYACGVWTCAWTHVWTCAWTCVWKCGYLYGHVHTHVYGHLHEHAFCAAAVGAARAVGSAFDELRCDVDDEVRPTSDEA